MNDYQSWLDDQSLLKSEPVRMLLQVTAVNARKDEAELWARWILSDPLVIEYKNRWLEGEEFSADDAASLVSMLAHKVKEAEDFLVGIRVMEEKEDE